MSEKEKIQITIAGRLLRAEELDALADLLADRLQRRIAQADLRTGPEGWTP